MSTLPTESMTGYQAFADKMLAATGHIALNHFRRTTEVEQKSDRSPVTVADRAIETYLRKEITAAYPTHGKLGEERGEQHADAELVWVIDPIDGTRSFISGFPLWGTLLALLKHGHPVLGIIDVPALNERWTGSATGCFSRDGSACQTSGCNDLSRGNLFATSPDMFSADEYRIFDPPEPTGKIPPIWR